MGGLFGGNQFQAYAPNVAQQQLQNPINQSQDQFNNNIANQGTLAQQLALQAQGQGPNPALSQLQQSTNANSQQAAAQAASTAGINPALAARLAVDAGANANQQAAGQAATMRANQELGAQGQLANLYGQMGGQQIQNQSTLQGALANQNQLYSQNQLEPQRINGQIQQSNNQQAGQIFGGLINGAGGLLGKGLGLASGGPVPSRLPDHLQAVASIYHPTIDFRSGGPVPGQAQVAGDSPQNDTVPAMVSPGEVVLPRSVSQSQDAPSKAEEFMKHIQDKKKGGYAKVVESKKSLKERVENLEKMFKGGVA